MRQNQHVQDPNGRSNGIRIWRMVLVIALVLGTIHFTFGGSPILPAPPVVLAAGAPCIDGGPAGGSYVAHVCFTDPADGSTFGTSPFTANLSITATSGTLPAVKSLRFYLTKVASTSHNSLTTDFVAPWTVQIPTTRYVAGSYRLESTVAFADGFTTTYNSVIVQINSGVTVAPHSNGSWSPSATGRVGCPERMLWVLS